MNNIKNLLKTSVVFLVAVLGWPGPASAATSYVAYDITPAGMTKPLAVANCTDGIHIGGCTLSQQLPPMAADGLLHSGVETYTGALVWTVAGANTKNTATDASVGGALGNITGIQGGFAVGDGAGSWGYNVAEARNLDNPTSYTSLGAQSAGSEALGTDGNFVVGCYVFTAVTPVAAVYVPSSSQWVASDLCAANNALTGDQNLAAYVLNDSKEANAYAVQGGSAVGFATRVLSGDMGSLDSVCWHLNANGSLHDCVDLSVNANAAEARAFGVNDDYIVGYVTPISASKAWLWYGTHTAQNPGLSLRLHPPAKGVSAVTSWATGVNKARNEVAGCYATGGFCDNHVHAWVWNLAGDESTWASSLPADDSIAQCYDAPDPWGVDLSTFLPAAPAGCTWCASCALAIDNNGNIVGYANCPEDSSTHAILWVPVPVKPAAPSGLTAVGGTGQITLSWTASTGATSYNVKRSTSKGAETTIASPPTAGYTNTLLAGGMTYYYVVTAVNSSGQESDNSSEVSATTVMPGPAAPSGLTAVGGTGQVTLSWTASTGATSYNVKCSTSSGAETTITNTTTAGYTNTGLASGTTYYYVVSAVDAAGEGYNSSEVSATMAPAAPAGLAAVGTNYQINLTWTASTGATSYNVKRSEFSGSEETLGSTTTAGYTDTWVIYGIPYYYVVTAVNAAGESGPSSEVSAVTLPEQPFHVSAESGNLQIYVHWTGVYDYDVSYNVKRSTSSGAETTITNTTATGYMDTNVSDGSTYYYVISAVNPTGEGTNSSEVSALAYGNLVQNGSFETGDFTGWTLSGDYCNSILDFDRGMWGITPHSGVFMADLGSCGSQGYLSQTLATTPGASYLLSFWVNNSLGDPNEFLVSWNGSTVYGPANLPTGGWTNIQRQVTATGASTVLQLGFEDDYDILGLDDVSVVPTAQSPIVLQAVAGNKQVTLTWTAPLAVNVIYYEVLRAMNSGGLETALASLLTTGYTDMNVVNGTTYYYTVAGVCSNGMLFSFEVSATPGAATVPTPPKLGGLTFTGGVGGGGFGFTFTNIPGASFTVHVTTDLTQPLSNWTVLGQPTEVPSDTYSQYQFTDTQASNYVRQFYMVTCP